MVERNLPKVDTRVRFSSPAPTLNIHIIHTKEFMQREIKRSYRSFSPFLIVLVIIDLLLIRDALSLFSSLLRLDGEGTGYYLLGIIEVFDSLTYTEAYKVLYGLVLMIVIIGIPIIIMFIVGLRKRNRNRR